MTSISFTGAFALQSSNGDAGQVLTEAAEFVNALAQMGVSLSVRVEFAPVDAAPAPAVHVNGSKPTPPANPTPAAPLATDEPLPPSPLAPERLAALNSGEIRFRDLNRSPSRR